ncbi:MAG TPA: hypothetical protein VE956_15950 [Nodularia sp. (in: cyanobacteria)]|nr:hypothetical protein [Nodularia sp. (in: cyanobacteria)]
MIPHINLEACTTKKVLVISNGFRNVGEYEQIFQAVVAYITENLADVRSRQLR